MIGGNRPLNPHLPQRRLAIVTKMTRHTQKWLPDLEIRQLEADVRVAEAEDYKLEHPEPDRAFFIGGGDEDY